MKTPCNKLAKTDKNCSDHMTKIAYMPIYGKKNFKTLLQNQMADDLGTLYVTFGM